MVSSALCTAPPALPARSSTATSQPRRASTVAATSPLGPEPMTTASTVSTGLAYRRPAVTGNSSPGTLVLAAVAGAELDERGAVDLVGGDHRHLARRDGPQGRGARAALEHGALAVEGAGAVLGDALAVDLDAHHPVEHEEQVSSRLALVGEGGPRLEVADGRLLAAPHHRNRELTLERRLDLGREGRRILGAPGALLAERPPVPPLEVDEPALCTQLAGVVVDPVPGKGAGTLEAPLDPAIRVQGQLQRRPGERGAVLDEGRPPHRSRGRDPGTPPGRLCEGDVVAVQIGLGVERGKGDRLERRLLAAQS